MEKEVKRNKENENNNITITKEIKPLYECRVLFISILDRIFILILLLTLIILTINNFYGDFSSLGYDFWGRILKEILIIFLIFIYYLILNWIYRCATKTILCVTDKEVYKEKYLPFYKNITSIPLNKITSVSTHNFLFIFRCIIIHQYNCLPTIFFTWNNIELQNKISELITSRNKDIENNYEEKNIITEERHKYMIYTGIILLIIVALFGITRLICYITGEERKVIGTYEYEKNKIILQKDGKCDIDDIIKKVTDCNWKYNKDDKEIIINYEYKSKYFYGLYNDTIKLEYNPKKKTINYEKNKYKLK